MAAPPPDPVRLRRVFELELEKGCANLAVVGGLDRMLIQLAEGGGLDRSPLRKQVAQLPPGGYRSLSTEQRRAWLIGTVGALKQPARAAAPIATGTKPPPVIKLEPGRASLKPDDPVTRLPGIGKAAAERLERLGVATAGDAALFFPRRYNDFTNTRTISELEPGRAAVTIVATVFSVRELRYGRRSRGTEAVFQDRTGSIRAVWFNLPYVARALKEGERFVLSGKVRAWRGRLQLENPEFEAFDDEASAAGKMVPVYPATQGLGQKVLRRAVQTAVTELAPTVPDPAPLWLRDGEALTPLGDAIKRLHYPKSHADAESARQRVALGELLAVQVAVLIRRAEWQRSETAPPLSLGDMSAGATASLPFQLTGAQRRTLDEVLADIARPQPMLRLLQGDVGSGKTAVAFLAMMAAIVSGHQAVLMAPTEILAEQHFRSFARLLGDASVLDGLFLPAWLGRPVRMLLMTGSLTAAQKQQARGDAANGGADILIGTHALLEQEVLLPRLGLAVVDEQHRFGVSQRQKLRQKGLNPHLLVMTATPIPRTLALTVYGDLDVSTIDELPPGRRPIKTDWVEPHEREEAYDFLRERLDAGEQAYVICPLVEESETLDARSAEEEYERLRIGPLKEYRVDLLHGRMTGKQKDEVMSRFAAHETDVLVSTSVIEVGIDVPNATVIVIEGAERFGLSQLHQFRGRVGRSAMQSYCLLFSTEEDPGPEARERLEAMQETNDGFKLAEVDLSMRGEGEAWGTLQSGQNTMLRVAKLTDRDILVRARRFAEQVLDRDPLLQKGEHRALAAAARPFLAKATEAN